MTAKNEIAALKRRLLVLDAERVIDQAMFAALVATHPARESLATTWQELCSGGQAEQLLRMAQLQAPVGSPDALAVQQAQAARVAFWQLWLRQPLG